MALALSLTEQIAYAEREHARCLGVFPTMVRGGVMARRAMDEEMALQDAIITSLRRLELFLLLADFGHVVPVDFIEAIRSPAHMEEVRAKLASAETRSRSVARG